MLARCLGWVSLLALLLAVGAASASATDLLPPPWRSVLPEASCAWSFAVPPQPPPLPLALFRGGAWQWLDEFEHRQGVISDSGNQALVLDLPQNAAASPELVLWIQITYWGHCRPWRYELRADDRTHVVEFPPLIDRLERGGGWCTDVVELSVADQKGWSDLAIGFRGLGSVFVDEISVDVRVQSELGIPALSGVGWLAIAAALLLVGGLLRRSVQRRQSCSTHPKPV